MSVFHKLRNNVFWLLDGLSGGEIAGHYREIENVLSDYHSAKSKSIRENHLQNVIKHAITSSEYYKSYSNCKRLSELPIINKNVLREYREAIISSKLKPSFEGKTSGSTGTPFSILQDKNKRKRNIADTLYFANKAGYKLGSKLIFIRVWRGHKKNRFTAWLQNIVKHDVRIIHNNPKKILDYLERDKSNKGIVGHASALESLSKYIQRNNLKPSVKNLNSVIGTSEHLNDFSREKLSRQLNVPVVSRYSNVENGIIAQQDISGSNHFQINWASYYVEILKFDEDIPVEIGELGRIVITDLFNYYMPLIRYDTGDIGALTLNDKGVPVFKSIEGRKLDLIHNTKGDIVPSLMIGTVLKNYPGIIQFQFIQEDKTRYILKLNVDNTYNGESKILKEFLQILGEGSRMNIVYTSEIPLLASGKRRFVVNNYLKRQQNKQKKLRSNGT